MPNSVSFPRFDFPMLQVAKRAIYRCARLSGLNAIAIRSSWRRQRLLVLCYHGISMNDEHKWRAVYIPPDHFRRRMQALKESGCNVLPMGEALDLLQAGTLPPRAVVITFDDGYYDFYLHAWPILREMHFPVTLYFSTSYSEYNVPVFDLMSSYLLWKATPQRLEWPEMNISALLNRQSHDRIAQVVQDGCLRRSLTDSQKDAVLRELSDRLGLNYDDFCSRRVLHVMNQDEAADLVRQGVDFQLHGHWHRVSRSRELFRREIQQNVESLSRLGVKAPVHYCYPAGFHIPEFREWLQQLGVRSAVTCDCGMASRESDLFSVPRFVDSPGVSDDVFAAWLSGFASWFPQRKLPLDCNQLIERAEGFRNGGEGTV